MPRGLRILLISLVVIALLLVGADRLAVKLAEQRIASELASRYPMDGEPDVTIHGFPLVTQALAGSYDHVEADASGVVIDQLGPVDVTVHLRDLKLEIGDALRGDVSGATAGRADAEVMIDEATLSDAVGMPLTIDSLTGDVMRVGTSADILGNQVPVTVDVRVVVEGLMASLDVQQVAAAGYEVPAGVVANLSDVLGIDFEVPTVVDGVALEKVSAVDGALVLHAGGNDVPLQQ